MQSSQVPRPWIVHVAYVDLELRAIGCEERSDHSAMVAADVEAARLSLGEPVVVYTANEIRDGRLLCRGEIINGRDVLSGTARVWLYDWKSIGKRVAHCRSSRIRWLGSEQRRQVKRQDVTQRKPTKKTHASKAIAGREVSHEMKGGKRARAKATAGQERAGLATSSVGPAARMAVFCTSACETHVP